MNVVPARHALTALVAFVALWPMVQLVLVQRFEVSPWKLFSLAMYCTPVKAIVEVSDDSQPASIQLDLKQFSRETQDAARDFRWRRNVLGTLIEPSALVARLFAERPRMERITIRVGLQRLDPRTSKLRTNWQEYRHARP